MKMSFAIIMCVLSLFTHRGLRSPVLVGLLPKAEGSGSLIVKALGYCSEDWGFKPRHHLAATVGPEPNSP